VPGSGSGLWKPELLFQLLREPVSFGEISQQVDTPAEKTNGFTGFILQAYDVITIKSECSVESNMNFVFILMLSLCLMNLELWLLNLNIETNIKISWSRSICSILYIRLMTVCSR